MGTGGDGRLAGRGRGRGSQGQCGRGKCNFNYSYFSDFSSVLEQSSKYCYCNKNVTSGVMVEKGLLSRVLPPYLAPP